MSRRRTVGFPSEWEPWADPAVVRSDGPQRIYDHDAADPTYEPPRIRGFGVSLVDPQLQRQVADLRKQLGPGPHLPPWPEAEPVLWDGDQA